MMSRFFKKHLFNIKVQPRVQPEIYVADEWVPIRPGTDVAMMSTMVFVMIEENLYDAGFVSIHCVGFDETRCRLDWSRRKL